MSTKLLTQNFLTGCQNIGTNPRTGQQYRRPAAAPRHRCRPLPWPPPSTRLPPRGLRLAAAAEKAALVKVPVHPASDASHPPLRRRRTASAAPAAPSVSPHSAPRDGRAAASAAMRRRRRRRRQCGGGGGGARKQASLGNHQEGGTPLDSDETESAVWWLMLYSLCSFLTWKLWNKPPASNHDSGERISSCRVKRENN
jgi:hypothetical protein